MSEEPPYYGSRIFVCAKCHREFTPTLDEVEAMDFLELGFGLPKDQASMVCVECEKEVK
jgi:DNA-directed RNA polymerase subunit RPC12/RpoP